MAIARHRVEIPAELGGGWVEIRERRGFMARTRLEEAGLRIREDVTSDAFLAAQASGRFGEVMEADGTGRVLVLMETAIAAVDQSVLRAHGVSTVPALLRSDDLSEELGDWLLARCVEICDADVAVRTKSGVGGAEPDAGRDARGDEGAGPAA